MKKLVNLAVASAVSLNLAFIANPGYASSHMDAPLITLDPVANTTDVYAFVSENNGVKYLTTSLAVYPFEDPGIGPNNYRFDDNVRYEIHLAVGDDLRKGRKTVSYQFEFQTAFNNRETILQAFTGSLDGDLDADGFDVNQNMRQNYTVKKVDRRISNRRPRFVKLGEGRVPPNNQGLVTALYNQNNDGEQPAKDGVASEEDLDPYTQGAIAELKDGYFAFAGQRDDGFYADIQSVFDLDFTFGGPNKPFDSQGGFNVHTIVLNIPVDEIGGDQQVVGVYATTSRRRVNVLSTKPLKKADRSLGPWIQVARQGNPVFNEALVALSDKDLYNRTSPESDPTLFAKYAQSPELARVLVPLLDLPENLLDQRSDIAAIYIPDVIKVDLSTEAARLAGGGTDHPTNPDDDGFSRLSVFGGDVLTSNVQAGLLGFPDGTIAGGWPNGRRFGDDVLDIAVTAVISDLRGDPLVINGPAGDGVDSNDIAYNKVFPYAATPLNGRSHGHH